ncbi:hypothetical protein Enr13x_17200 [Stieleria neptunia]|uniref:DUF3592 domain-containing protein n=1 Tax=Stieleria neptunia TaxID=2527979 RepID=A0A518HM76_9BACT|nr:DUF3592 domain-containing protein [Stieleria neptunia]QDV41877.1 hypothetical protein Enr13x_17200 [Stieleria neptunia]
MNQSNRSDIGARLLFGIITLMVGSALLGVRQVGVSGLKTAQSWTPTPCLIERSEFDRDSEGDRYLVIEYRYLVNGKRYRGDRLDMVPGRGGDEGEWEQQLHEAHPKGAEATCYVNPDRPDQSVLDPTHGDDATRNLLLLSTPFLTAGAALLFSVGWSVVHRRTDESVALQTADPLPPPPRNLTWPQRVALLRPPTETLLAWAFLVGFVIIFKMLEGPEHVRDLMVRDEVTVEGSVTAIEQAPAQESRRQLYELSFQYEYADQLREGVSYTFDGGYDVDDPVTVVVDPGEPSRARIAETRQRLTPVWILLFPGGVIALLVPGIVTSYLSRFRYWGLARHGEAAGAILVDAGRSDVANPLTKHEFTANGSTYLVNPRSAISADQLYCTVLYRRGAPHHNVGLSTQDEAVLHGDAGWRSAFGLILVPLICVAAIAGILAI